MVHRERDDRQSDFDGWEKLHAEIKSACRSGAGSKNGAADCRVIFVPMFHCTCKDGRKFTIYEPWIAGR